jgi:hypothetical protein
MMRRRPASLADEMLPHCGDLVQDDEASTPGAGLCAGMIMTLFFGHSLLSALSTNSAPHEASLEAKAAKLFCAIWRATRRNSTWISDCWRLMPWGRLGRVGPGGGGGDCPTARAVKARQSRMRSKNLYGQRRKLLTLDPDPLQNKNPLAARVGRWLSPIPQRRQRGRWPSAPKAHSHSMHRSRAEK